MPTQEEIAAVFPEMTQRFQPEKAEGVDATILFDLSGDNGGQYWVKIADGTVEHGCLLSLRVCRGCGCANGRGPGRRRFRFLRAFHVTGRCAGRGPAWVGPVGLRGRVSAARASA